MKKRKEKSECVQECMQKLNRYTIELIEENEKLKELIRKNEDVIINIRDMLYENDCGEYTYERDIIRAELDREYNYLNGDDVVDFYQRKKD